MEDDDLVLADTPNQSGVFGIMPVRATGLQQPQSSDRKRPASVVRDDPAWRCVEIKDETDSHQPRWQCVGCKAVHTGGAARIADHLLGRRRYARCIGTNDAFLAKVDEVRKNEAAKEKKKARKSAVIAVNAAASTSSVAVSEKAVSEKGSKQPKINFNSANSDGCDAAIAELFFACNIPASVVDHPKFKQLVTTLKAAPPSYKTPHRKKLLGSLLHDTVSRLQRELQPLRNAICRNGATIISDGWDTVSKDHLVNCLYGNASCVLFDGTVELTSEDSESADFVAELLRQCMERNGRFAFVQVCFPLPFLALPPSFFSLPFCPFSGRHGHMQCHEGSMEDSREGVPMANGDLLRHTRAQPRAQGPGQAAPCRRNHCQGEHGALPVLGSYAVAAQKAA